MKCKLRKEFKDNAKLFFSALVLFNLVLLIVGILIATVPFLIGFLAVWVFEYIPEYFATSPHSYYSQVGRDIFIFIFILSMLSWVLYDIYKYFKNRPKREVIGVKVGIFKRIKDKIFECERD